METPGQQAHSLEVQTADGQRSTQRFWLYLPPTYFTDRSAALPLVVFMHGSGERGSDLQKVKVHGPPKWVDRGKDFPFILVSPQLDDDRSWQIHEQQALVDALRKRLRIDPRRITATGLSLGGMGAWNWACAYPDRLAAIAPVCGYGDPAKAAVMRSVPVWAFHGDADGVVAIEKDRAMVDALRAAGGQVELTVYPGLGHNAWDPAYENPELYAWLMRQTLQSPA